MAAFRIPYLVDRKSAVPPNSSKEPGQIGFTTLPVHEGSRFKVAFPEGLPMCDAG